MVYHISKVCITFIYMQHKHMVYGELHIHYYLVLDKNSNDNAYSNPFRHEVWNLEHKIVMLGIDLCYKTFSHIGVQHQHYPEHDIVCLFIFFPLIFFVFFHIKHTIFEVLFFQMVLKSLS